MLTLILGSSLTGRRELMKRGKRMRPRWCGELTRLPIRIRFRTDPDGSQKGWRVARTWLSLQTPHPGWRTRACGAIEAGLCLKIKLLLITILAWIAIVSPARKQSSHQCSFAANFAWSENLYRIEPTEWTISFSMIRILHLGPKPNTVELHNSRLHNSRKLQNSRQFAGDRGFLFYKNP